MKVYGGTIMCDLFALNYSDPSFSCKVKYTTPLVSKPYDWIVFIIYSQIRFESIMEVEMIVKILSIRWAQPKLL